MFHSEYEDYIIFDFGTETVIGKLAKDPLKSSMTVEDPRVIKLVQKGPNELQVMWLKLLGTPARIHLPASTVYYHPTDEQIVKGYIQMTSGLTVAAAMPRAGRN